MKTPATREEIESFLGDVDPFTIERILATRASVDDISAALADLEDELRFGDLREPTSTQVAEVRTILQELADVNEDEQAYAY